MSLKPKKVLSSCQQDLKNITKVLHNYSLSIDSEFIIVPQLVVQLLQTQLHYSSLKPIMTVDLATELTRLSTIVNNYYITLESLQKEQKLLRHLQSPHLNHHLILRNTLVYRSAHDILESIKRLNSETNSINVTTQSSKSKPKSSKKNTNQMIVGLEDSEAKQFWTKHWPNEDFMVAWKVFEQALKQDIPNTTQEALDALKYLMDFSDSEEVSICRLNMILKLAPSFKEIASFASWLLTKSWFHGHLTKDEASVLLQHEPINTFIIRLKQSSHGGLACSYKSNRGILHHIIQHDSSGYSMLNCEGNYPSLDLLIDQQVFLKHPLDLDWIRQPWFLGDATKDEASNIVSHLPEGTYVVHITNSLLSSSSNNTKDRATLKELYFNLTTKFMGAISHTTITRDHTGTFSISGKSYTSLHDFLSLKQKIFVQSFSPRLPSFRARLDSPATADSVFSASTKSSGNLNISSISLSLSSSVTISRKTPAKDDRLSVSDDDGLASSAPEDSLLDESSSASSSLESTPHSIKKRWRPLTDEEINPNGLTYRDIWVELLKYYHVPVPEAMS